MCEPVLTRRQFVPSSTSRVHTKRAQSQRSARPSSTLRRVRCCSPRVTFTYSALTSSQNLATLAPHSSEDTELMSYKVRRALPATRAWLRGSAKVLLATWCQGIRLR